MTDDIWQARHIKMALEVLDFEDDDIEDINGVNPVTYSEPMAGGICYTVYFFGERAISKAIILEVNHARMQEFAERIRYRNIKDVRTDAYGCVLTMDGGKKVELKPNCDEGPEAFKRSMKGFTNLWEDRID
jgi:hypothetical protein